MIISILELLPTRIVTSPLTSFCSFCNSRFELLLLATEPVSNTEGLLINTSKVHINNMYIKYTFVHFAILLIRQVSRAVPLLVTISFAVEALSSRLGSSFRLLHGSSNLLAILLWSSSFFPMPFYLKLVVWSTINIGCFSGFLPSSISASQRAWESFSLSHAYYSSSRSSSNLVMVTRELYQSLSCLED